MRVHPSILLPKAKRWQFPAILALFLFLIIINLVRGPREVVNAAQVPQPQEKQISVLVAKQLIPAGQSLERANLALEMRAVKSLPADVMSSFDAVRNRIAAGPIPAGYVLSAALLSDPQPVLGPADVSSVNAMPDPIDLKLKEIEEKTVAMPVTFNSDPPQRGARVALTISNLKGDSVVVMEEAWVSKTSGREAVLRLDPQQALLLQSAKNYGNFNFIEIAASGESPYAGKAIKNKDELIQLLNGDSKVAAAKSEPEKRKIKGYAWVTGEGVRYGLDEAGEIKVVGGGEK